jgi:hypothetical protein
MGKPFDSDGSSLMMKNLRKGVINLMDGWSKEGLMKE